MTLTQWCLFLACLLPYVCAVLTKAGKFGPRDNRQPRVWLANQEGWRARANAAQANSWEALPVFIAAAWVAQQHGMRQALMDELALAFVALRVVYILLYVSDRSSARSLVWAAGIACCAALFFMH
jgi:uncharacterized MAPEG superfamily protein